MTRAAQGGALLLAGAAIAVVLLRFELPEPTQPAAWPEPPAQVQPDTGNLPRQDIDSGYMGQLFNEIAGIKPQDRPEPVAATPDPDPQPITQPASTESVRFIGAMLVGDRSFAIVSSPSGQSIVRVGETLPNTDAEVVSISPDELTIETDGRRDTIERQVATRALVSSISPAKSLPIDNAMDPARAGTSRRDQAGRAVSTNPDQDREAFRAEVERRRAELQRERQLRDGD